MTTAHSTRRLGRITSGIGLLGFGALLVVEDLIDPTNGDVSFADAAITSPGLLTAAALTLLGSAVLTVPAIGGILHQARDRGSILAGLGAFFTLLGAMGHAGLAVLYLIMRSLAGGDPGQMADFENRINEDPTLVVAFVLLTSFGVGITLLAWSAWRAGLIGWWAPGLVTLVVLVHAVVDDAPAPVSLAGLTVIAVVFGRLGVRALRMTDSDWDRTDSPARPMPVIAN